MMSGFQEKRKKASLSAAEKKHNSQLLGQKNQLVKISPTIDILRSMSYRKPSGKLKSQKTDNTARSYSSRNSNEKLMETSKKKQKHQDNRSRADSRRFRQGGSDSTSRSGEPSEEKKKFIIKNRNKRIVAQKNSEEAVRSVEAEDTRTPPIYDYDEQPLHRQSSLHEAMGRNLRKFAQMCNGLMLKELLNQFNNLPNSPKEECKNYFDPRNRSKNRYNNVYCLDKSRVILTFLKDEGTYIHANKVLYSSLKNPFIITQGPLPQTVNDFWRLIWQEKTENIVMLCNAIENGRNKSCEYFPQQLGERVIYGQIIVKTCTRETEEGLVITKMEVSWKMQIRTVMHYQMTEWRDCRAPVSCARQLFQMLAVIREGSSPPVIHCSAGVGRSGTLVALEMCLMDLAHGRPIDVQEVVRTLRKFRSHCVQTFEQYLAIHKFVLQFGEQNECVRSNDVAHFNRLFDDYSSRLV